MKLIQSVNRNLFLAFATVLLTLFPGKALSDGGNNRNYLDEDLNYSIYSNQIDKSVQLLKNFISLKRIQVISYSQHDGLHSYKLKIRNEQAPSLDSLVNFLGFRASKSVRTSNNKSAEVAELKSEVERLNTKRESYQKLLSKMDSVHGKSYLEYFEKIMVINDELYRQNAILKTALENENTLIVEMEIHDDYAVNDYSDIMFVHMPGAEANLMFIENPAQGVSATAYQGISLKYLFTKGKSYFSIGDMKPVSPLSKNDSSAVKDIFSLAFGQDFYNRHLGRGKRKFLNLYIGYQVGLANARSNESDKAYGFVAPVTGLELFKNKYINLDVNGSYYIPVNDFTYTLRGIKLNASLNFSF